MKIKRSIFLLAAACLMFAADFSMVLAQNVPAPGSATVCTGDYMMIDGVCQPKPLVGGGNNSLTGATTLMGLITVILKYLLYFAGAVAVVFVVVGGYQYITSGGNEESAEKGKKTLINASLGVVAVVLAYAIITVITNLVTTNR